MFDNTKSLQNKIIFVWNLISYQYANEFPTIKFYQTTCTKTSVIWQEIYQLK